jgi:hypothetical protein
MAGEARSNKFMLATATVMLGPREKVFDLTPDEHSIGLVKNFRATSEPSYTDLTQGVKNTTVYSVMTGNVVRASMEAYEYTAQNVTYALGLEGATVTDAVAETDLSGAALKDDTDLVVTDETDFAVDDYIMIQQGSDDQVYVRQITAITTGSISFAEGLPTALAIGTAVRKSNVIAVGSKADQPYLAAKIVGSLADGSPVSMICPKIRITNGFSFGFTTEGFDNMPLEFSFYDSIAGDPFYSKFKDSQAQLHM